MAKNGFSAQGGLVISIPLEVHTPKNDHTLTTEAQRFPINFRFAEASVLLDKKVRQNLLRVIDYGLVVKTL